MRRENFTNENDRFEELEELQHMNQSYAALQQNEESKSPESALDDQRAKGRKFGGNGISVAQNGMGTNGNGHKYNGNGSAKPIRVSSDDSDDLFPFGYEQPKKHNISSSYQVTAAKNGHKLPAAPIAKQKATSHVLATNGSNGFKSNLDNGSSAPLLGGGTQPWTATHAAASELKGAKEQEPAVQRNGNHFHLVTEPEVSKPRDSKLKGLVFTPEPSAESLHANQDNITAISPYKSMWLEIPKGSPIFPFDGNEPRVAEQYRILRTSILLNPGRPQVVAVSSGSSGDGKTITAINIAGILAMKSETTVLIVEGDLRKCALAPILGINSSPGLAEVLRGTISLDDAIIRAEQLPNFHVLPAGTVTDNPAELLDSDEFRKFVKDVRKRFSFVVFDTTPAASVADFKLVMQVSDGVLMVVRPDHTDRDSFQRAFELVPEKLLLGAVINAFEDWFLWKKLDANYYYSGEVRKTKAKPFFNWRRRSSSK